VYEFGVNDKPFEKLLKTAFFRNGNEIETSSK
jgi:hypothetical protein